MLSFFLKIFAGIAAFFYLCLIWYSTFFITYQKICPVVSGIAAMRAKQNAFAEFDEDECNRYTLYQVFRQSEMPFTRFLSLSFIMQKRTIGALYRASQAGEIHVDFVEKHFDYQGL